MQTNSEVNSDKELVPWAAMTQWLKLEVQNSWLGGFHTEYY